MQTCLLMLVCCLQGDASQESLLSRQSLYVKFDPLVKGPGLAVASSVQPPSTISELPTGQYAMQLCSGECRGLIA